MPKPNEDGSLSSEHLFGTFYNCYRLCNSAAGNTTPEWDELAEWEQTAFLEAFERAKVLVEEAEGTAWATIGANVNLAYQLSHGSQAVAWEDMPEAQRLVWVAMVRHLLNMIVFDAEEDGGVVDHEERIAEWYAQKLAQAGLTQRDAAVAKEKAGMP